MPLNKKPETSDNSATYYLAADTGATVSRYLLLRKVGENSVVEASGRMAGFNYSISGKEGLFGFFKSLLGKLSMVQGEKEGRNERLIIGLAIAGAGRAEVKKLIVKDIASYFNLHFYLDLPKNLSGGFRVIELYLLHDGESALWSVFEDGVGIIVNSGTGSIAFGRDRGGNTFRAGGWGHIAGDEGSAYWIGREGISRSLRVYDGRGFKGIYMSSLLKSIPASLGMSSPEELVSWLHSEKAGKKEIADISIVVEREAKNGDTLALEILRDAGKELAELAGAVIERLIDSGCVSFDRPIALTGSVFQKCKLVRKFFEEVFSRKYKDMEITVSKVSPEMGVKNYLFHLEELKKEPDFQYH